MQYNKEYILASMVRSKRLVTTELEDTSKRRMTDGKNFLEVGIIISGYYKLILPIFRAPKPFISTRWMILKRPRTQLGQTGT